MLTCNQYETKLIMDGSCDGIVRRYPDGCPHSVKSEIVLTSKYLDGVRNIPFARATITSIKPGTVAQFRRDNEQAKKDGYKSASHWFGNINRMYKGLRDDDSLHHLSFRIIQIDKDAGLRPDKEQA